MLSDLEWHASHQQLIIEKYYDKYFSNIHWHLLYQRESELHNKYVLAMAISVTLQSYFLYY